MFTLFGEGYWEDSGSYGDATQRLIGQELLKSLSKGVRVWTFWLPWGVDCMCATDDWVGVGGIPHVTTPDARRRRPTYQL